MSILQHHHPEYLLKSFAKTTGLNVRLYRKGQAVYQYFPVFFQPDPIAPQLDEMLLSPHRAGVILTPLDQHYGYVKPDEELVVLIGPTAVLRADAAQLDSLCFHLGIPEAEKAVYGQLLCGLPRLSAQQLAWMLAFFMTAVEGTLFGVEKVHIETGAERYRQDIAEKHVSAAFEGGEETGLSETVLASYHFERIIAHYIQNGQVEPLRDLYDSISAIKPGKMATDLLRQHKNAFICGAAVFSRAAIEGGLDPQASFRLSDLYIQKCELLREPRAIAELLKEMGLDFAARVRALNYGQMQSSKLFESCAHYVNQHLFSRILVKEMAAELNMSVAYLSNLFRVQTGKTLSQFILEQKITEAKRLLRYTNKNTAAIATHLAFSSQSHFQTVFKKQVGATPLAYRKQPR